MTNKTNGTRTGTKKLTAFGKAVRHARLDAGVTLRDMATELGWSTAYLSSVEYGEKPINATLLMKIEAFFEKRSTPTGDLFALACLTNGKIPLDGLPVEQQQLLVKLASSILTLEQIAKHLAIE